MYYFFWFLNAVVIVFISYLLLFSPDQLATGIGQRAISLAIITLTGLIALTALSVYFKLVKQLAGFSILFIVLAYLLIISAVIIFISKQKWM